MNTIVRFFSKPLFTNRKFVISLWFAVVCLGLVLMLSRHVPNNYIIFKHVFYHTIDQITLYGAYPEYANFNYYGPVFSLIIAPFALLPDQLGVVLFGLFTSLCLFLAIYKLLIPWKWRAVIYYITLNDLFVTTLACQTNTLIAALVIGSFILIRKEKDMGAACLIALGLFIKLYGVVGLAFFFFSRHKIKFTGYFLMWSVVFFVLPMIISSPQFIIQTYVDWFAALASKNELNAQSLSQDYSVMGMIRRITGNREMSNLVVLIPAVCIFAIQYLRIDFFKNLRFQLGMLALTLLTIVIFSSGSESPTYIIAMTGVGIWFVIQSRPFSGYNIFLLGFALVVTSFSRSDLLPKVVRTFIQTYALIVLPCLLIWLALIYHQLKGYRTDQPVSSE